MQTFRLAIPETLISDHDRWPRRSQNIADRLSHVPGVGSVGLSSSITMDGEDNGNALHLEDFPVPGHASAALALQDLRARILRDDGQQSWRDASITWTDIYERSPSSSSRRRSHGCIGRSPQAIGQRVRYSPAVPWREIVGVIGNEHDDGLNQPATAMVYWPLLNDTYGARTMSYAVRSSRVGMPGFVRELQQAVWSVNADLPLAAVQTLQEIQARSMARTSFAMTMLAIAAAVALLPRRCRNLWRDCVHRAPNGSREIGVRMALGAQVGDVRRCSCSHGLGLTATGIALGIGAR